MVKNRLHLTKLRFTLRFRADSQLPPFVGNMIRGAFGHALSRQCCEWDISRCAACGNVANCAYGSMFKAQNGESVPNPYVISVPYPGMGHYRDGSTLDFSIVLCGSARRFEADVVCAAKSMCTGSLRNTELADAWREYDREWSDCGAETIEHCDALEVQFVTPTEIRSAGEAIADISFALLVDSLFGRIAGIIDHYTDSEFELPYCLMERKPFIHSECDLRRERFSTSGQPIDGILGTVRYFGDVTRYLPYIDLGSQLHVGKKTTRGCGEYVFGI